MSSQMSPNNELNQQQVAANSEHYVTVDQGRGLSKFNRALIIIGVFVFVLIVTDRIREAFRADGGPLGLTVVESLEQNTSDLSTVTVNTASVSTGSAAVGDSLQEHNESLRELQRLFGSRVVFISSAKPAYVITADERRFEVGGEVNNGIKLAGVTANQLIFEQSGDLTIVTLPEAEMQ